MAATDLPRPTPAFDGRVARLFDDASPQPLERPTPSSGPNIVLIMLDDVGFGTCSTFGGPVPTPGVDRVARQGLRFNQFHTTALCSPTRAALLTGRNHHTAHMGGITEISNSFPGYDSAIPRETAMVSEILRQNGYATACFGKWHLTPSWEQGPAGPFDRWPTGQGFDRFYGIIGAEASHYEPPVYDQTTPIQPNVGRPDYHLTEDLADQAIEWIQRHRASAPDRPFFCYFSTAAVHAPHHVWPEWSDRFAGQFDQGWDALREQIYARQLELGVIPPGTALTARPDEVPAWSDYPDRYKPIATRLMEVFAGFMAHTDAQVLRVLDSIDELGVGDDTLVIYLTGDNGASAEGTIHGAWSAPSFQNGVHEDPEWLLERIDDFGTERCENHFNVGWAWALDAPFQWMKQVASHFGGTRNALAVSWPRGIAEPGALREGFHHVIDIVPTLLEVAGIDMPQRVGGIEQEPLHGASMAPAFAATAELPDSSNNERTQYFEILGNRAIYHDGWIASCFHGRVPWIRYAGFEFDGPDEQWELYDVANDFSQSVDLAAAEPERLAAMQALFETEAERYGVYPLRDASARRGGDYRVPRSLDESRMTYTNAHVRMPESSIVNLKNATHQITARVTMPTPGDNGVAGEGVIACQGGAMAGWSLWIDGEQRPHYLYNCFGHELTTLSADSLEPGEHELRVLYVHDGGFGAGGTAMLFVNDVEAARAHIERTVPVVFSMSGETFDVGIDTGSPVGPYPHDYRCTASIASVTLERLSKPDDATREQMLAGLFKAGMSTQ